MQELIEKLEYHLEILKRWPERDSNSMSKSAYTTMLNISKQLLEKEKYNKAFIRFGDIPTNERSSIYCGDSGKIGEEIGVSVYDAINIDGEWRIVMPKKMTYSTCVSLSGFIDKEFQLVTGDLVGYGSDGEPLIVNVKTYNNYKI